LPFPGGESRLHARAMSLPFVVLRRRFARRFGPQLLLLPGLAFLLLVFAGPILMLLSRSLFDPDFTLEHYRRMFEVPEYLHVMWSSFQIAALATALSLAAGYPLAYVLNRASPTWRAVIFTLVLLPFWTNILVRCYAWMLVLQNTGVVNRALVDWLGLLQKPAPLVFNFTGTVIGMVHYLLPPMVLILFSVMRAIDLRLVEAAASLGADPWRGFRRIFLPLSLPGVRGATTLVFILGLGFFVTPALLGGRKEITIAMLIDTQFSEMLAWGFGSALSVALLTVTLFGLTVYYWFLGRDAVRVAG
ncbi:MAG: binding-protein-dependent transport system inner rane component, partial [Candidatus Rokubacteria bacterium]|nr:binding-protein-dependent transport system inner rane component [Candidatus Rokubacteria bacterium]